MSDDISRELLAEYEMLKKYEEYLESMKNQSFTNEYTNIRIEYEEKRNIFEAKRKLYEARQLEKNKPVASDTRPIPELVISKVVDDVQDIFRGATDLQEKISKQGFAESMKNRMGIGEPETNSTDTYERGMGIIPDNISISEEEIPVKQYTIAILRNLLRFERSEGRLQITSKRVIFRAVGRSIGGRTTLQQEYKIEEISGVEASRGFRFSFLYMLLGLFVVLFAAFVVASVVLTAVPNEFTVDDFPRTATHRQRVPSAIEVIAFDVQEIHVVGIGATLLGLLFGSIGLVPFFAIKKRFLLKLVFLGIAYGSFAVIALAGNPVWLFLFWVSVLLTVFGLFLNCMRPDFTIIIKNNGASESAPIIIRRSRGFFEIFARRSGNVLMFSEVIPTPETEKAIREMGAIIRDIQTHGDFVIDKWKNK